ncbi:MAG: hypothetical protein JOZ05_19525 [Acetobacteraceae bacterium]|nr:hypothetical protein [Acetobacteraceae bacterium]
MRAATLSLHDPLISSPLYMRCESVGSPDPAQAGRVLRQTDPPHRHRRAWRFALGAASRGSGRKPSSSSRKPMSARSTKVEQDGKLWRRTLREGLRFHDGEPVRAQDVVVSSVAGRCGMGSARSSWPLSPSSPPHPTASSSPVCTGPSVASRRTRQGHPEPRGDHAGTARRDRSGQAGDRHRRQRAISVPGGRARGRRPRCSRQIRCLRAAARQMDRDAGQRLGRDRAASGRDGLVGVARTRPRALAQARAPPCNPCGRDRGVGGGCCASTRVTHRSAIPLSTCPSAVNQAEFMQGVAGDQTEFWTRVSAYSPGVVLVRPTFPRPFSSARSGPTC